MRIPQRRGDCFPLSLVFEDEGFGFEGGEIGRATSEAGKADGFASVV